MVKWLSVFIIAFVIADNSYAQKNNLVIEGITPKLFISHKVISKENFYSISRMYNVPPKEIAAYNNLQFENGLNVGELIRIPLTENNFSQSESETNAKSLPVYHSVQPKEGLYRVSLNYNKVSIITLKKWNHLQSDNVSSGTSLIVGYLKVSKNESPLANKGVKSNTNGAEDTKTETKPEPVKPDINPERLPPVKNPDINKQEKKDVPETDEHKVTKTSVNTKSNINFSGGYFKKLYNDQSENKTPVSVNGNAGTFKSTSGWQDGKYYCFNNEAAPGTIIKITDNSTNKSVYAKVLDAIPDIKQNSDLAVIVSNAAAEELGAGDVKFDCTLNYVK
ncbi:MAG: LysM peptidoglycan-binding domain-containing protein [Ginsengibacter sp.]